MPFNPDDPFELERQTLDHRDTDNPHVRRRIIAEQERQFAEARQRATGKPADKQSLISKLPSMRDIKKGANNFLQKPVGSPDGNSILNTLNTLGSTVATGLRGNEVTPQERIAGANLAAGRNLGAGAGIFGDIEAQRLAGDRIRIEGRQGNERRQLNDGIQEILTGEGDAQTKVQDAINFAEQSGFGEDVIAPIRQVLQEQQSVLTTQADKIAFEQEKGNQDRQTAAAEPADPFKAGDVDQSRARISAMAEQLGGDVLGGLVDSLSDDAFEEFEGTDGKATSRLLEKAREFLDFDEAGNITGTNNPLALHAAIDELPKKADETTTTGGGTRSRPNIEKVIDAIAESDRVNGEDSEKSKELRKNLKKLNSRGVFFMGRTDEGGVVIGDKTTGNVKITTPDEIMNKPIQKLQVRPISQKEREGIRNANNSLKLLTRIETLFELDESTGGPFEGRVKQFIQKDLGGLGINESDEKLIGNLKKLNNAVIKALSGSTVPLQEAQRIMSEIPAITDTPSQFKAKMEIVKQGMTDVLESLENTRPDRATTQQRFNELMGSSTTLEHAPVPETSGLSDDELFE